MNILQQTHHWILKHKSSDNLVIDMTAGNGHDTLFLAQHFKRVITIDIQETALKITQERLKDYDNVTYVHADHSTINFKSYGAVDGAIYNLGYLPHSDKTIITTDDTTLQSLDNLLPILKGFLVITCYVGHDGGETEHQAVLNWILKNEFKPTIFKYEHKEKSPIAYCIKL